MRRYIKVRLDDGFARGTVQNEIAYLRAAFRLAHRESRLRLLPYFPTLTMRNTHKVFYEAGEARALIAALDIVDVEDVRQAFRNTDQYRETRTEPDNRRVVRL